MKAILETGFKDYVAQEFVPLGNNNDEKIASIKKAVKICDVWMPSTHHIKKVELEKTIVNVIFVVSLKI